MLAVRSFVRIVAISTLTLMSVSTVFAQILPPIIDPTGRSGEPPPLTQEDFPETPQNILPPILPPKDTEPKKPGGLAVLVREIHVIGSTVFSHDTLEEMTKPYTDGPITTEDLEELRRAITLLYINEGYINSGAIIPDQTIADGIVTIQVIEGKLTNIDIEGTKHFFPFYLRQRLSRGAGDPFNVNPLRERLQLLLQDNRIQRMNAELKPGLRPGEAELKVQVEEESPYKAWLEFNNFQSPTVGAERGMATVEHRNLTGIGDVFRFTYGQSAGINPLIDTSYVVPLTPWDTSLILQYRKNDFDVIEAPFDDLDIQSESDIFTMTLRQPIYQTTRREFALAVTAEHLRNQNFLLGEPFSFTAGTTEDGESNVSALRFSQQWIDRTPGQVISLHSRFSFGIDTMNATNNDSTLPDTQFFSWLGQAQVARRLETLSAQVISRMDLQLANDRLFPLEQFAVGGRYSVRGYRENQIVRDNAFLFSVESRIPIFPSKWGTERLQLAPFIDVGRAWNTKDPTPDPKTLASTGLGLRWSAFDRGHFQGYWGIPLNHVDTQGGNLQDSGIHLQFVLELL